MLRHLPKLLWTLAAIMVLYFVATSFSIRANANINTEQPSTRKTGAANLQNGFDIKNLSHHLLDF